MDTQAGEWFLMSRIDLKWLSIPGLAVAGFVLAPGLPFSLGTYSEFSYIGPLLVMASGLIFMRAGLGLGIAIGIWRLNWIRLTGTGYLMIGLGLTLSPIVNFVIYDQFLAPDRLLILACGIGALWLGTKLVRRTEYNMNG